MKFLEEFNRITENKYNYLRLTDYFIDEEKCVLNITFVVPYEIFNDDSIFNSEVKGEISNYVSSLLPEEFGLKIKFDKVLVTPEVVLRYINSFIRERYVRVLDGRYNPNDIKINIGQKEVNVILPVEDIIYSFCESRHIDLELAEYLDSKYNFVNQVSLRKVEVPEEVEKKIQAKTALFDDGHVICKSERIIAGHPVSLPPIYISRFRKPQEGIIVCGKVLSFEKKTAKSGRLFFKFKIEDPTGVMSCIYFTRATKHSKDIEQVHVGGEYIINGDLMEDSFNKSVVLFARGVLSCKIDTEATLKKIHYMQKLKKKAEKVKIEKYNDPNDKEYTLLDERPYMCPLLERNDFVVFDLETTGLDPNNDRIVEIGAVRISQGIKVSTFHTFIDPEMRIPDQAFAVNKITEDLLDDAPLIQDVIGQFVDYCHDAIVVGQNAIHFDIPFIKREAKANGYLFENRALDTKDMARQLNPGAKSYSLATLCKEYKVVNNQAHRALSDALATADLFMILANELKLD